MTRIDTTNQAQQQLISELDRNILLIAAAGTGKTDSLARRIARIIETGRAQPGEILCLTFTNKACKEMQTRITSLAGANGRAVIVKTFHSFCYDVIKTEAKKSSDLFTDFAIFDEEDCKEIITTLKPLLSAEKMYSFLSLVKETCAACKFFSEGAGHDYSRTIAWLQEARQDRFLEFCSDKGQTDPAKIEFLQTRGAAFTAAYNEKLQEMHGLDFTDLITTAQELFQIPSIQKSWQHRFRYINIDEVQDTNELEYHIISQIFGTNHLLLCGDYFQTVYEWRGSHPHAVLQQFLSDYAPVQITFQKNYRTTQLLLQASSACLNNLFGTPAIKAVYQFPIQAMESAEKGSKIQLHAADGTSEEARWIYERLQTLQAENRTDQPLSACILTRNNSYTKILSHHFARFNVESAQPLKFLLTEEFKFFRRQEIKDVLAFARLILNKHDTTSITRILKRFAFGIGAATIAKIDSPAYRQAGIHLTDYVDENTQATGDSFGLLLQALQEENLIVFDVESTGIDTMSDEIIQIAAIRLDKAGQIKDRFCHFLQLSQKTTVGASSDIHGFTDEFLAEKGEPPKAVLRAFLAFIQGSVIAGHNVAYDIGILRSYLDRLGLPAPAFAAYYDTLDIYRRFYPNLPSHKLEALGEAFSISHRSSHDAYDDICATAELLKHAVRTNLLPTTTQRRTLLQAHLPLFRDMTEWLSTLRKQAIHLRPCLLLAEIINTVHIKDYYERRGEADRVDNLRDLYRVAREYDQPDLSPLDALQALLQYTALSTTELDALLEKKPQIPIITIHQAKGSEFDYVFLAGLQEDNFPTWFARKKNNLEEEKRLFYVAITRAKRQLYLSWSQMGNNREHHQSQFINAIPKNFIEYA